MTRIIAGTAIVSADILASISFSVDQNIAAMVGVLVATIIVVIAVISYIDRRIESKLRTLEELMLARHDLLFGELKHLRELLGVKAHAHSRKSDPEE